MAKFYHIPIFILCIFGMAYPLTASRALNSCTKMSSRRIRADRLMACFVMLLAMCLANIAHANPKFTSTQGSIRKVSGSDLTVSQYELALVQVLSEICPPMLNSQQRIRFTHAYNEQLRSFLPTSANPNDTLRQLHTQRDYRAALQSVRAWTASYPKPQNQKLCMQFVEVDF